MAKPIRTQRVAERIRKELSEILLYEVTDPRLVGVTVTDVTVDRELEYARVYISTLEGAERQAEVIDSLERAAGFLRFNLSQRIELRSFPHLRFKWDPTAERAERIEELFASLQAEQEESDEEKDG
jgi:ribosome-binding factor A